MTFAHKLMDVCLWIVAIHWFIGFLARGPKPARRNRKLLAPSSSCERTAEWRTHLPNMVRRQAD
jgi:hypothetical protein